MCSTYRPMIFVDFQPPARMIGTRPTNARFSSGPKSVAGKTRSARNAFRHGFNVPVALVPDLAGDVEALARRLCGEGSDPSLMELARRVAEAQIDLRRVRAYRQRLIQRALTDQGFRTKSTKRAQFKAAEAILRDPFNDLPEDVEQAMRPPPVKGREKLALIVADYAKQLAALDRYERRALSRRKFAIREFDAARWRDVQARPGAPAATAPGQEQFPNASDQHVI